jgi:hypothetical protein
MLTIVFVEKEFVRYRETLIEKKRKEIFVSGEEEKWKKEEESMGKQEPLLNLHWEQSDACCRRERRGRRRSALGGEK